MDNIKWNQLQLSLFDKLYNQCDDTLLSDVIDSYKSVSEVWSDFNNLLSSLVDDNVKVYKVKEIGDYLIIKLNIFEYIVIDLENRVCLDESLVEDIFGEEYFVDEFREDKDTFKFFDFINIDELEDVIEFYNNNSEVILGNRNIRYEYQNENGRIGIDYNFVSDTINLYIHGFGEVMRVNYIFFDKSLNPIQVTNPTGNMDDLRVLANRVKDLRIPGALMYSKVKRLKLD